MFIGNMELLLDKYNGVRKSLQTPMNCRIKQVTSVGFNMGTIILKNMEMGPAPSITAASSNSTGSDSTKFRMVKIQNGIIALVNAIIIPNFVFASPATVSFNQSYIVHREE